MPKSSLPGWLAWVKSAVQGFQSEPAGEIILDGNRGTIPLEKHRMTSLYPSRMVRRIAVVDGGSAPVLQSPSFMVALLKVYGAIFEGTVCSEQHAETTTAILRATKDKKIEVKIEHLDSPISFDSQLLPPTTSSLVSALNQVRTAMELTTARTMIDKLRPGDILLLDGCLVSCSGYDSLLYESLSLAAKNKDVFLMALSKTTQIGCTNGISATAALRTLELQRSAWFYHGNKAEVSTHFTKLHPRAPCILRIDGLDYEREEYIPVLEHLVALSRDPAFFGYPYPLVKAHQRAKIDPHETRTRQAVLRSFLGKQGDALEEQGVGHDYLDQS